MKKRISTCIAGACVAGLMVGAPATAMANEQFSEEALPSALAAQGAGVWSASDNMNVDLYGPPSVFEGGQVLYGPPPVVEEPIQVLYGPPSMFADKDNTMFASTEAKSVKATRLAVKAKVFKKAIKVKKAKGEVSFARLKKGSSKALSVDAQTGAVTVAKGTEKGVYVMRVRVSAAGNANYRPATQTVRVKVRVK